MKFGVVVFPGSNCDDDTIYALRVNLGQEVVKLWHKDHDLQGCDFVVLPGGFSYGDYLRSGAIARFSPIMEAVVAHAQRGGYVMGICNGFQVICEAGLAPGVLLRNDGQRFVSRNIYLKAQTNQSLLTDSLDLARAYKIPIAHADGRYYANDDTIKLLNDNDQILFRYCDENGAIGPESNPNGSVENIAGVCNQSRNVFGMMPHPERAADPALGNTDGKIILEQLLTVLA